MRKITSASFLFDETMFANTKKPIGLYWFLVLVLVLGILVTAIAISEQTQERHRTYRQLQALKQDFNKLKIEEQRLRIEQQTFGSTSQVVRRSVDELGMFYPSNAHRQVISQDLTSSVTDSAKK